MIDDFEKEIDKFLTVELKNNYGKDEYHFFKENDIVWTLHKRLLKLQQEPYKIFNEFPVEPIVPLTLTKNYYNKLLKIDKNIENYYSKTNAHYELNDIEKNSNNINIFSKIRGENISSKKYSRIFEPKYFDLAIVKYPTNTFCDELIYPNIFMEFKYEINFKRKGNDVRRHISLPKNSIKSILSDILAVSNFSKSIGNSIGYFVLIDEGKYFIDRQEISNIANKLHLKLEKINDCKYSILIIKCK